MTRTAGASLRAYGLALACLACLALASCSKPDIRAFVQDLSSPNVLVRQQAVAALALAGDTAVVPHLMVLLDDPVADVRQGTAKALGTLHDMRATEAVVQRLARESDGTVRRALIEALGKLRDTKAVPDLLRRLEANDFPATERYTLIWALGNIGDPRSAEPLGKLLSDSDQFVAYNATQALKKLRSRAGQ